MKKIVSVLSAVGLALSLAACAPGNNTTKTSEYRPMNTGAPNTPVGYDRYNTYNNTAYPNGDGRYDTYRNGIIKDQTNYRTRGLDTRLNDNGMTRYGVNVDGTRNYGTTGYGTTGYGTTNYGTTHQYSIYKPKDRTQTITGRTNQPDIGLARLGDNLTGPGRNGAGVYNYNGENGSIFFPRLRNQGNGANTATPNVYVDRQMLASACANAAKQIPGVKNATVLTTDNQIFIGCDTSGQTPAQAAQTLKKVQMSCENLSPRYCKVYTTNDQNITNKVYNNAHQMGNKTDSEFEKMIGHRPGSLFHLSSTRSTNSGSGSRSSTNLK